MDRLIGFFILFFLIITFAHGQVEQPVKTAVVKNNWISGELINFYILFGAGARYERMLSPMFSLGSNFYLHYLFTIGFESGIDASFRYYPWKKYFFIGTALGFGTWTVKPDYGTERGYGLGMKVTPEIGWKIDVGKAGGFFLSPGIKWPFTFGNRIDVSYEKTNFRLIKFFYPLINFGIGYAF